MIIVQRYCKQVGTTENRDMAIRLAISNRGGIPIKLQLQRDMAGKLTWHNGTPAVITDVYGVEDGPNVNDRDNFPGIFKDNPNLSYSCPGQGIGGLECYGKIKIGCGRNIDGDLEDFRNLKGYISSLNRVDPDSRDKFEEGLRTMLKPSICDRFKNICKKVRKPSLKEVFWGGMCAIGVVASYWRWIR